MTWPANSEALPVKLAKTGVPTSIFCRIDIPGEVVRRYALLRTTSSPGSTHMTLPSASITTLTLLSCVISSMPGIVLQAQCR